MPADDRIDAVLFDFAGVVTNDPFGAMLNHAIDSGIELRDFVAVAIGQGDYAAGDHPWHQLERGEIELADFNQATDEMARSLGYDGFPPLPAASILDALHVRPEMLDLISELRTGGLRTGIITNNVKALGAWRQLADWDALVDVVIDSCEVGMRKPEARIFQLACSKVGVDPANALFLDDMQANVDGAEAAGLSSMLVTDPTAAVESVKRLALV